VGGGEGDMLGLWLWMGFVDVVCGYLLWFVDVVCGCGLWMRMWIVDVVLWMWLCGRGHRLSTRRQRLGY